MALRVLMLKKRIDDKRTALDELKKDDFATREAELEKAIEEANSDEERSVVDEAIETFETEKRENAEKIRELEGEISDLEKELREIEETNEEPEAEENQPEPVKEEPAEAEAEAEAERTAEPKEEKREKEIKKWQ